MDCRPRTISGSYSQAVAAWQETMLMWQSKAGLGLGLRAVCGVACWREIKPN
ncbi:hypothetical protein DsansV1_C03g0028591 [Dioscorea sansibarensis]